MTLFQMACQDLEFSLSRVNNVISKLIAEKGKNVQEDFSTLERLVTVIQVRYSLLLSYIYSMPQHLQSFVESSRNGGCDLEVVTILLHRAAE